MNNLKSPELICQSCSMPLKKPADFGTNADGSRNEDYCCYCYQKGEFTEPNITMDQMIDKVAGMMIQMQNISEDHALEICVNFIPKLKRWRK
ncbi:MAG: zinc ribbon domain-containing protein [Patescibacteria group bacterium]